MIFLLGSGREAHGFAIPWGSHVNRGKYDEDQRQGGVRGQRVVDRPRVSDERRAQGDLRLHRRHGARARVRPGAVRDRRGRGREADRDHLRSPVRREHAQGDSRELPHTLPQDTDRLVRPGGQPALRDEVGGCHLVQRGSSPGRELRGRSDILHPHRRRQPP